MGTWFSDKYAEGTVGHRFYAGCQNVDTVESVAAEHARELFGAPYAYVQPHSGIDANLVAFWSILAHRVESPELEKLGAKNVNELSDADWEELRGKLGNQRLLGMSLDSGGHLTHGFRPNISGKMFHQQQYGTDPETGLLDYDAVRAKAREFKPLIIVAGYSAYPRRVNFAKMREIADEVGATLMVDMAHFAGLVAGKVFTGDEDPVPHAHVTTTTTHKSLRGPRGGLVLAQEEYAPSVDRGCPMVLGGPLSHMMAAKAVALAEARQPEFQTYAQAIADNAKSLAEGFLKRGAKLVTGGTDNHIVLLDVSAFGLTGRQAEFALLDAGVVTNRNSVPQDPNGAWYTSGIRIGTPALTTRGFGARRVRQGRRADGRRAVEHPARHEQGRRPVEGDVRPRRRRRRPRQGRLRRDARQAPPLPRPRAHLTVELRLVMLRVAPRDDHEAQLNASRGATQHPTRSRQKRAMAARSATWASRAGEGGLVEQLDRQGGEAAHHQHVQGVGPADDGLGDLAALVAQAPDVRRHVGVVAGDEVAGARLADLDVADEQLAEVGADGHRHPEAEVDQREVGGVARRQQVVGAGVAVGGGVGEGEHLLDVRRHLVRRGPQPVAQLVAERRRDQRVLPDPVVVQHRDHLGRRAGRTA